MVTEGDQECGDQHEQAADERRPLPLDTDKVTLYLFSIEGILIR